MSRILIIEDNKLTQAQLAHILDEKYNLSFADDGLAGLAAVPQIKPDLILLDFNMPKMDGYQVCKILKGDTNTQEIPLIFITSLSSEKEKVQGFEAGAEDYIVKPFYPEELLARVRAHLESRRAKEQAIELEKLKILREMAVALSHQINNPLTAVYGCLYILEKEAENLTETALFSLDGIKEGLEKIKEIVTRLSQASRVAKTTYNRDTVMIDLHNI